MKKNFTIESGGLYLCNDIKSKKSVLISYFCQFTKIIFGVFSLLLTLYITLIIYRKCISNVSLSECIPLGSIFATFGSALISVFAIYNDNQYSLFKENLETLRSQIPDLHSWQRWPFLKRYTKEKALFGHCNYYILLNPQITFELNNKSLTVPVPSCIADFKDLPVTINTKKMICFRRQYYKFIHNLYNMKQEDLMIFDCVLTIYINIVKYKCGTIVIWIGAELIFSSILFSFFCGQIMEFTDFLTAYF